MDTWVNHRENEYAPEICPLTLKPKPDWSLVILIVFGCLQASSICSRLVVWTVVEVFWEICCSINLLLFWIKFAILSLTLCTYHYVHNVSRDPIYSNIDFCQFFAKEYFLCSARWKLCRSPLRSNGPAEARISFEIYAAVSVLSRKLDLCWIFKKPEEIIMILVIYATSSGKVFAKILLRKKIAHTETKSKEIYVFSNISFLFFLFHVNIRSNYK